MAGRGTAGHLAVRPDQGMGGLLAGSPGRVRRPGQLGRDRRVPVRAGGGRIDGVMGQPLGRHRQIPGVSHREESAHQDGAGRRGHRQPPPGPPGHPARVPARGRGPEVCAARRGRRERPGLRERPELGERPGLPGQFAAFRRRRQGGEYLGDRLRPGGVTVRPSAPVRQTPVRHTTVRHSTVRHTRVPRATVSRVPVQQVPVQQRVREPLPAGTVRPAAPLAFCHAAFETTGQPDALHGADSRVLRPRMLTARNRA